MSVQIRVRAIVVKDNGKLFCVRLKAYEGSKEHDYWCLPGGAVDEREGLEVALRREMLEETGVAPQIGELLYIQHFVFEGQEQLEFFFHVTNTNNYKNIDIAKASHAEIEIAEFGFVDTDTTYILPSFLSRENIVEHIESKQPTKIFSYL